MALTKKHFEALAEMIATARMFPPHHQGVYLERRLINWMSTHGHNFNEKIFYDRITQIQNELNASDNHAQKTRKTPNTT